MHMPKIINFKKCFCSYSLGITFTENKSKIRILASTLSSAGGPLLGLVNMWAWRKTRTTRVTVTQAYIGSVNKITELNQYVQTY